MDDVIHSERLRLVDRWPFAVKRCDVLRESVIQFPRGPRDLIAVDLFDVDPELFKSNSASPSGTNGVGHSGHTSPNRIHGRQRLFQWLGFLRALRELSMDLWPVWDVHKNMDSFCWSPSQICRHQLDLDRSRHQIVVGNVLAQPLLVLTQVARNGLQVGSNLFLDGQNLLLMPVAPNTRWRRTPAPASYPLY